MKIAFLTTDDLSGYVTDDNLIFDPLRELGHVPEFVSWKQTAVGWREFDAVIIRSTWDYQNNLSSFLSVLQQIESETILLNPLGVVRWNVDKVYLRNLASGARTVPTIWHDGKVEERQTERWFEELQSDELVVKPTVGASAQDTLRLRPNEVNTAELTMLFDDRPCMVQPFMRGIVEEGEFSLFYFGGGYSHAILKTPKRADFRVQEEHGGSIQAVEPTTKLLAEGEKILKHVLPIPLYARIDFVRAEDDDFVLMELELIEPSLYLREAEHAPQMFAETINEWLSQKR